MATDYWVFKMGSTYVARDEQTNYYKIRGESGFTNFIVQFSDLLEKKKYEVDVHSDLNLAQDERDLVMRVVKLHNSLRKLEERREQENQDR